LALVVFRLVWMLVMQHLIRLKKQAVLLMLL
jgi:hypothetical protein